MNVADARPLIRLPEGFRRRASGRPVPCAAAVLLAWAAAGTSWFTLGWSLAACGILGSRRSGGLRTVEILLLGLAGFLGPEGAGWTVLVAAGLLAAMEEEGLLARLLPAAAVPVAAIAGVVSGLVPAAAAAILAAFLPVRLLRRTLAFGVLLAGMLWMGPPLPSERIPIFPEHVADRFPLYDWHDLPQVHAGSPELALIPPGAPSSSLFVTLRADYPSGGDMYAWIRMGDVVVQIDSGKYLLEFPGGSEPIRMGIEGSWHPFLQARMRITQISGETQ